MPRGSGPRRTRPSRPPARPGTGPVSSENAQVNARILAQLLAADFLSPMRLSDKRTRQLRRQMARRAHLVRQRTRIKNQVHSILAQPGPEPPLSDLFTTTGRWRT
ncbi:MAG TPA: transposase [Trebonia sp.]|nr:transposase [Trebonia sp.]